MLESFIGYKIESEVCKHFAQQVKYLIPISEQKSGQIQK